MFALRFLCVLAVLGGFADAASAACSPLAAQRSGQSRTVTARDIIELGEIGFPDGALSGPSPLAVSPDGKRVAFVLTRANIATNSYCRGLVVVQIRRTATPTLLDSGGEFVPLGTFVRGLWVEVGLQKLVTPVWSPDGQFIAMIKRQGGVSQAVAIPLHGHGPPVASHSKADVESLWWGKNGKLYFKTRGALGAEHRIAEEGQSGWLYDDRMAPNDGVAPRLRPEDTTPAFFSLDRRTGVVRAGREVQGRDAGERVSSRAGREVWLQREEPSPVSDQQLWLKEPSGDSRRCVAAACRGRFEGLWWSQSGKQVWFLKREGWNRGISALYRWDGTTSEPVRSLQTGGVLDNCVPAEARLLCTLESTTKPRVIVLVDPSTGGHRTIFDPNPAFSRLDLGTVSRLKWRNDRGLEAWGDLVLPPNYRKGAKLPLIVVQYNSRGFLRGGTGNEYLIYPLAAAGYAVLSFDRPAPVASSHPELKTEVELNAINEKGWAERWSLLSALVRGVDLAIATGAIDPKRIGITGLSDGATSARFALLNSNRFAAAAISSCCLEPKTVMTYGGIRWAEFNRAIGYPPATDERHDFWRPMSLAVNADRFATPLLIQQSDDEYLLGLEAFEALREKHAPAELYVFPGEHHVKWQPRHKLAVFTRTRDWFDFWLRCRTDPDAAKAGQYERWKSMRGHTGPTAQLCSMISG